MHFALKGASGSTQVKYLKLFNNENGIQLLQCNVELSNETPNLNQLNSTQLTSMHLRLKTVVIANPTHQQVVLMWPFGIFIAIYSTSLISFQRKSLKTTKKKLNEQGEHAMGGPLPSFER